MLLQILISVCFDIWVVIGQLATQGGSVFAAYRVIVVALQACYLAMLLAATFAWRSDANNRAKDA
jgi:hypothetical protein